ncbi:reverse transcriptase domain-containing protein [Tanacetum coccineum]
MPAYTNPNLTGAALNPVGSVTPFVRWIEDYPLPDGQKMPFYIGSYDGKGDPDNFLHLFEGAILMQKWLMLVACHMFTYTLKDSARIWWNCQKAGLHEEQRISSFVHGLRTRSLVERLSTDLPSTYKGLIEKTYICIGQNDRGRFSPYKGQKRKLLSSLVKSPREILATEKVAKTFEQPPRLLRANWSKDKTRYCHFHEDYGHETDQCRELKHRIEEAVKSGQLTHLVKGVKKKKEKTTGTRLEERKKEEKKLTLDKVHVLMISGRNRSSDLVLIKLYISGRQVNRVYLDGGREQSWPLGEIPLEVTIGEGPIAVTKTLTFMIVKSDSPHNLMLGRTAMQQMGIVVSTVHGAIKFHTPRGATYQKLIDKVSGHQMGRNMEVNADDIVIKSDSEEEMMADIVEPLEKLRAINLKLNPKKCSFRVEEGIYSGHLITKQGIRADPSKVKAVSNLRPPKMISEMQNLKKKIAALSRFLSKSAEKKLPFMKTLKSCTSGNMVQWMKEADEAFRRMKEFLESLPTMVIPTKGETLTMYLATSEENYPELEKLILALVYAARKLRRYFQAHPIQVLSDKPIKQILAKPEKSGHIAKWAIELGEHEIEFKGRNSIKGQILADFLAETPLTKNREAKNEEVKRKEPESENAWKLFTDGASSSDGVRAVLMVVSPEGKEYTYALRFEFETTNNEAEYEALLAGLRIAKEMEIRELIIFEDSQLVANQVKGLFEAR